MRYQSVGVLLCAAATSSLGAPPAFHDAVSGDEPVLWYQFNEAEGSASAVNHGSLGPAFDGVYYNGVGLEAETPQGYDAACFTAPNAQYVESQSDAPPSMRGNPSFTAEAVVRVFDTAQAPLYAPFLHWGIGGTGREVYFSLQNNNANRVYAGFYNGGMRMTDTIGLGEWVHVVWVRSSGGGVNNERTGSTLYINGQETPITVDTDLCCSFVPDVTGSAFRVQKARDYARFFSGDIDEVALYDRLLSAKEVRQHYEALVGDGNGGEVCYADVNGDGVLDLFDFLAFVNLFNAGDPQADCVANACEPQLDLFDFLCFVNEFNSGCP
jgi:hypothetical protein